MRRLLRFPRSFSTMASASSPRNPLIAIVGATGTGKSDLAVELARKFKGEIINGDAMQMYNGLPIITNKIKEEERKGVPHHLLGCIGLHEEAWTAWKFVPEALKKISEIRSRGNLPILVGGTHYYTQSLLFQDSLTDDPESSEGENSEVLPELEQPTDVLLARLKQVDPVMAERWHPNDRRKIQRSLEIYLKKGKPASEIYGEQRKRRKEVYSIATTAAVNEEESNMNAGLRETRFSTLVFWVHANRTALYPRLDARVHKMLEAGLLSEVQELHSFQTQCEAAAQNSSPPHKINFTRGIWISIGYKEFLAYQTALSSATKQGPPHTTATPLPDEVEILKSLAIEKTQTATRRYTTRQIRFIRIKLLNALSSSNARSTTFLLDGTDLAQWDSQVIDPAMTITASFLAGQELPAPESLSAEAREMLDSSSTTYDLANRPDLWAKKVCEVCAGMVCVTPSDWEKHLVGRVHRRLVAKMRKNGWQVTVEDKGVVKVEPEDKATEVRERKENSGLIVDDPGCEELGNLIELLERRNV